MLGIGTQNLSSTNIIMTTAKRNGLTGINQLEEPSDVSILT